jgi:hypothetical protein
MGRDFLQRLLKSILVGSEMSLPQTDIDYLTERGLVYSVTTEANMTCILFPGYGLPSGYNHEKADLLIRLNPGYPDVPPDMWWFDPPIRLSGGGVVQATEATENHLGRSWQRWSRHFNNGQWQSGIDSLESYLALIHNELERCSMVTK